MPTSHTTFGYKYQKLGKSTSQLQLQVIETTTKHLQWRLTMWSLNYLQCVQSNLLTHHGAHWVISTLAQRFFFWPEFCIVMNNLGYGVKMHRFLNICLIFYMKIPSLFSTTISQKSKLMPLDALEKKWQKFTSKIYAPWKKSHYTYAHKLFCSFKGRLEIRRIGVHEGGLFVCKATHFENEKGGSNIANVEILKH